MINARHDRAQKQSLKGPPQQSITVISKKHSEKTAPNDLGLILGAFQLMLSVGGGRSEWGVASGHT